MARRPHALLFFLFFLLTANTHFCNPVMVEKCISLMLCTIWYGYMSSISVQYQLKRAHSELENALNGAQTSANVKQHTPDF